MDYEIIYEDFITEYLPTFLRKPKHLAWLMSVNFPIVQIYNQFLEMKALLDKEASYNSQTMLFEYILNKRFDPIEKRIYIMNYSSQGGVRVSAYLQSEHRPKVNAYLYSEGFEKLQASLYGEFSILNFIVFVPDALTNSVSAIVRLVKKYKLAGKTFKIQIF